MRTVLLFIVTLFFASGASAQSVSFFEPLTLTVAPDFPEPQTTITLRVDSTSLDLDRASIAWYADDTLIAEGGGLTETTFTLGPLGSATHIAVVATDLAGESESLERTIRPAEVDLLWEAVSYTPPLYQGKRLVSSSSEVRMQALPRLVRANGSTIPTSDIIYTWRKNGALVSDASGRGKAQATFPPPLLFGTDTIQVEAVSLDGTLTARASAVIPSRDPQLVLYHKHPLFGTLYHQALTGEDAIPDVEAAFVAEPYFAPVHISTDRSLMYTWRVNGTAVATDATNPNHVTLNAQNSTGAARIELKLTHTTDVFLESRGSWNLLLNSRYGGTAQDPFQGTDGFFPGTE